MNDEIANKFRQQKADFLDQLQPDDFRNGASFNSAEEIIDQLHKALLQHAKNHDNYQEFITKALANLFRENSPAKATAMDLANLYLEVNLKPNL